MKQNIGFETIETEIESQTVIYFFVQVCLFKIIKIRQFKYIGKFDQNIEIVLG